MVRVVSGVRVSSWVEGGRRGSPPRVSGWGARLAPAVAGLAVALLAASTAHAQPLAVFEHHVVGARLQASPAELFVPKDIPGSILVQFTTANGSPHRDAARLGRDYHIEAVLRGPAFPAYRLLGFPNEPLLLPPIALVGEYQIDDIRLVHTASGETRTMAAPSRIAVHVFPEVFVSQVVSRPLSIDEIAERGIVIDASSFSAVEFEATFTLAGRPFRVKLPVVTPRFRDAQEVIGDAEREERTVEAARLNRRLSEALDLPPEMRMPGLDLQIQGANFKQVVDGDGDTGPGRGGEVIPGLVVIPGSVGFLNQFFSVQIFTANAAPTRSTLSVHSIEAELILPPGRDRLPNTDDDPIRLARVGPEAAVNAIIPVRGLGPDGRAGTPDDAVRLQPGQSGQGEFLVEGRREGLHTFDIRLRGTLDGYAQREVRVEGIAAGSVLVRNPRFSIVFSHPRAVRAGEPYTAAVTVMNTSEQPAYLVSANLNRASLSGVEFAPGQAELVSLGDLAPGESGTAQFHLIARATGEVRLAELTGEDGLSGRFDLTTTVDERGVALSNQVIGYPEWVGLLPEPVRRATDRVLGQALASATAAILPPGIRRVELETVRQRVIELAEAGQRLAHGDDTERVYLDLILDWHGGRTPSRGFDQIMRETSAGAELRQALLDAIEIDDTGLSWVAARAADVAGRGEAWGMAATDAPEISVSVLADAGDMGVDARSLPESGYYRSVGGAAVFVRDPSTRAGLEVVFRVPAGSAAQPVEWISTSTTGTGVRARWTAAGHPSLDVCYRYLPTRSPDTAAVDTGCTRASSGAVSVTRTTFTELPPELLAADQDLSVLIERPGGNCQGPHFEYFGASRPYENYGTLALLLFSKPMSRESLMRAGAVYLDSGIGTTGVAVQPGGRVVLANFRKGFGTLRPAGVELAPFVTDERGVAPAVRTHALDRRASEGVAIAGRVVGADGGPVAGVPVTLTMHDTTMRCFGVDVRSSQVYSDDQGRFTFDFVMADVPYSLSATDIRGLSDTAVALLREAAPTGELDPDELARLVGADGRPELWQTERRFEEGEGAVLVAQSVDRAVLRDRVPNGSPRIGSTVPVALRFRGRGRVSGTVLASDGVTPVANAAVNLFPEESSNELGRGMFSTGTGQFDFAGVPLGELSVTVAAPDGSTRVVAARLDEAGQHLELSILLPADAPPLGTVEGTVYEADGLTPHPMARVAVLDAQSGVVARGVADGLGQFTLERVPAYPAADRPSIRAVSADGRRGVSRPIVLTPNGLSVAHLVLPGVGVVQGRVELANGQPAPGALVAGGESIVTADGAGIFTLQGVPSGNGRRIAAGLPSNVAADGYVRLGAASVDVVPGSTNFVVVRLNASGRIRGRVYDAASNPIPYVNVAIPGTAGFWWVTASINGDYLFPNMALGEYALTAPSAPTRDGDDTAALVAAAQDAIGRRAQADLEAAMAELLPRLSMIRPSSPEPPPPPSFGVTSARVIADGQTVVADIRYLPSGTIAGRVLNHAGVPIAAELTLSALTLNKSSAPQVRPVGRARSDALTGEFEFAGIEIGPFTVVARSSYYPGQVSVSGLTTLGNLDAQGLVLQFLPPSATGARLSGRVMRDGVPAGAGVQIEVAGRTLSTNAEGVFDTQAEIAQGQYHLHALEPSTGRRGYLFVNINPGQNASVEVTLLSVGGGLDVSVVDALGQPVGTSAGSGEAEVTAQRVGMPITGVQTRPTTLGLAAWSNLMQGTYAVRACRATGQTRLCGGGNVVVPGAGRGSIVLQLNAAGTIRGTLVAGDNVTPVPDAQVVAAVGRFGEVAVAVTDSVGVFEFIGVPLGTVTLTARNPATGRHAVATAQLVAPDQVVLVRLREDPLGDVVGGVVSTSGVGFVPGADVTLYPSNPLFPARSVTTDPAGQFEFPGVPPGRFQVYATDTNTGYRGYAVATMPSTPVELRVDVPLERRGTIEVRTVAPSGPQAAHVRFAGAAHLGDTNAQGLAAFSNILIAGTYTLEATSLLPGQTRSVGTATATPTLEDDFVHVELPLSGVGAVTGVVLSAQAAPVLGAEVTLEQRGWGPLTFVTAADGRFSFPDVAPGDVRVRARSGALAGATTTSIAAAGQTVDTQITLTPSGDVSGRLVRADGLTAVPNADLVLGYTAPASGLPATAHARTSSMGQFVFRAVPYGSIVLRGQVPRYDGALAYRATLATTTLELGDVALDELRPTVVETVPVDGAVGVLTTANIQVTFSEAMDPLFADGNAAFLVDSAGVRLQASLSWQTVGGETRRLVITPSAPLASQASYSLVVLGPRQIGLSGFAGPGPVDMAERSLVAPYTMRFTTLDAVPPAVQTFTPDHLAEQQDPSTVIRVTFSEPMDRATAVLELMDISEGLLVPTTQVTGLDDRLLVATPVAFLEPNRIYEARLLAATDRAGNSVAGLPRVQRFATVDTIGPTITDLAVAGGLGVVAGASVGFVATVTPAELGVQVQATQNLLDYVLSDPGTGAFVLTMGAAGSTATVRARGIDRFGNFGPWYEETFAVSANTPPSVVLAQITPSSGPLLTGQAYAVHLTATDDSRVVRAAASLEGALVLQREQQGASTVELRGTVPSTLGPGATTTVRGWARDNSGLTTTATAVVLTIGDGAAPTLSLIVPNRQVQPGETFDARVVADDAFGVTEVTLATTGGLSFSGGATHATAPLHTDDTFALTVPVSANAGTAISFVATVRDAANNSRQATATLSVADIVPPTVVSVSPANNAMNVSVQPSITVTFSEPVVGASASNLTLSTGGQPVTVAVSLSGDRRVATLVPGQTLASLTHYELTVGSGIADDTGLALTPVTSGFTTENRDLVGPRLVAVRPASSSTGAAIPLYVEFEFDEPVQPGSLASISLTPVAGGPALFGSRDPNVNARIARYTFRGAQAPSLDTEYTTTLAGLPTDAAGNPALDTSGGPWAPVSTSFRTGRATLAVAVNGYDASRVVEGYAATARVVADASVAFDRYEWWQDGAPRTGDATVTLAPPMLIGGAPGSITVEATVRDAVSDTRSLAPVTVTVEPRGADFDNDGFTNGIEANGGTNPWEDDADLDPDTDGLDNATELALGTNPNAADSDSDGVSDALDLTPLGGNRIPGVGLRSPPPHWSLYSELGGSFVLPSSVAPSDAATVELWSRRNSESVASAIVGSITSTRAINIAGHPDGRYSVVVRVEGAAPVRYMSQTAVSANAWHHLAATYDGQRVRLFVDGRREVDAPLSGVLDHSGGPLGVFFTSSVTGYIDELRVWSVARSASAILTHLHQVLTGEHAGLVAAYSFDVATEPELVVDTTGHGHLATGALVFRSFEGSTTHTAYPSNVVVNMVGPLQPLTFAVGDLDGTTPSILLTRLPQHGVLRARNGNALGLGGLSDTLPTYEAEPGYVGRDTIELIATDGVSTSVPLVVTLETPPAKTWLGTHPTSPNAWTEASNWSPVGIPTAQDAVVIPAGTTVPTLAASSTVAGLYVAVGGELALDTGVTLLVNGHTLSDGVVLGLGRVQVAANGAVVRGRFENLLVGSQWNGVTVRVGGTMYVAGNLVIRRTLDLQSYATLVGNAVTVEASAGLRMTSPTAVLDVGGSFTWAAISPTNSTMSAGLVCVRGRFDVLASTRFRPSGSHTVELTGARATLHIEDNVYTQQSFFSSWTVTEPNYFHNLALSAAEVVIVPPAVAGAPRFRVYGDLTVGTASQATSLVDVGGSVTVAGNAIVRSGSLVSLGSLTVAGSLTVGAMSTVVAPSLSAGVVVASEGVIDTSALALTGVSDGPALALGTQVSFDGLTVLGDLALDGPLTVNGDLTVGADDRWATLSLNGQDVFVSGELRVALRGSVVMSLAAETLEVLGTATIDGGSELTAGTLIVRSLLDVVGTYAFNATAGHTTVLAGSGVQVRMVNADANNNHFGDLEVAGTAEVLEPGFGDYAMWVAGDLRLGRVGVSSLLVTQDLSSHVDGTVEIEAGSDWTSNAPISLAAISTPAGTLSTPHLILSRTSATALPAFAPTSNVSFTDLTVLNPVVLGGNLVARDLVVGDGTATARLTLGGYDVLVSRNLRVRPYSGLQMSDGEERLDVAGTASIDGHPNIGSQPSDSVWSAGTLSVGGALEVTNPYAFSATGSHLTVLTGPSVFVRMVEPGTTTNHFHNLAVIGTTAVQTTLAGSYGIWVSGDLEVGATGVPSSLSTAFRVSHVDGRATIHADSSWSSDTVISAGNVVTLGNGQLVAPTLVLDRSTAGNGSADETFTPTTGHLFTNLTVAHHIVLGGPLTVPGDLDVVDTHFGRLTLSGLDATVGGSVTISPNGGVVMTSADELFTVAGNFTTHGSATYSTWTGGTLQVGGDLDIAVAGALSAGLGHTTELYGPTSTLRMSDAAQFANTLGALLITSPNATILQRPTGTGDDVRVAGTLTLRGTGSSAPAQLTVPTGRTLRVIGSIFVQEYSTLATPGSVFGASCTRNQTTGLVTGTLSCP